MPPLLIQALLWTGAFILARRLCGDALAAGAAAAAYAFAPDLAQYQGAWLLWPLALPILLLLFYRIGESEEPLWRAAAPGGAFLALAALAAPAFAICAGTFVWLLILGGFSVSRRRDWSIWGPSFTRWGAACAWGALLYAPLWLRRAWHPVAPLPDALYLPSDAAGFFLPGAAYLGFSVLALAACGGALSRSYRSQARLWLLVAGLLLWLRLGTDFYWLGRGHWWIPCLYLGFAKIPWLRDVPPLFYMAPARLALTAAGAYGGAALLARLPEWRLRYTRALLGLLLGLLTAADLARR